MGRLPQPGGDDGAWGAILNDFLLTSLDTDGQVRTGAISTPKLADGAVTSGKLDPAIQSMLNSVASGGVASVNTRTGSVTLSSSDVGLANVSNTSDAAKPISTATQSALDAKAALAHTHTSAQITDATTVGKSLLTAVDASAVRSAIGAGTSSVVLGTTSGTAKAGDYAPTKVDLGLGNVDNTSDANKPISTATQNALASTVKSVNNTLPDGTGNVTIVVSAGSVTANNITDSTTVGRSVLVASDAAAARTAIALGNIDNTSDVNKPVSTATQTALSTKATDTNVVHLAGAETLSGAKTFSVAPLVPDASFATSKVTGLDTALSTKQSLATDLTTIAALSPANDDLLQRKSGGWTNRTPAQLKLDLGLTSSDVGLGNVNNTSDLNKPVSTATQTALGLKADATSVGAKVLLIANAAALPAGTPAGVIVVVQA